MKKVMLAIAVASTFVTSIARAEDAPAPPPPDNVVTYNASVVSDYRYRGISQSNLDPALQGGADYTNNPTGLYAGTWLSTIKWITDAGGSDSVEWDLYAGKRGEIVKDVSYDIGVLSYVYPGNDLQPTNANTTELYGQLGYGPVYAKYSYSLTNLFGFTDSKGSGYVDLGGTFDMTDGYSFVVHAGHQTVANTPSSSYTDWKVGVTKDFGVVVGALAVIGTNTNAYVNGTQNLGKNALNLSISKTF